MAGRPWTERERRLLRELVRAGEDLASMADELGRSWHGVRLKLAELGESS